MNTKPERQEFGPALPEFLRGQLEILTSNIYTLSRSSTITGAEIHKESVKLYLERVRVIRDMARCVSIPYIELQNTIDELEKILEQFTEKPAQFMRGTEFSIFGSCYGIDLFLDQARRIIASIIDDLRLRLPEPMTEAECMEEVVRRR